MLGNMLKWTDSDTNLTIVCRHHWSRKMTIKVDKYLKLAARTVVFIGDETFVCLYVISSFFFVRVPSFFSIFCVIHTSVLSFPNSLQNRRHWKKLENVWMIFRMTTNYWPVILLYFIVGLTFNIWSWNCTFIQESSQALHIYLLKMFKMCLLSDSASSSHTWCNIRCANAVMMWDCSSGRSVGNVST